MGWEAAQTLPSQTRQWICQEPVQLVKMSRKQAEARKRAMLWSGHERIRAVLESLSSPAKAAIAAALVSARVDPSLAKTIADVIVEQSITAALAYIAELNTENVQILNINIEYSLF